MIGDVGTTVEVAAAALAQLIADGRGAEILWADVVNWPDAEERADVFAGPSENATAEIFRMDLRGSDDTSGTTAEPFEPGDDVQPE